MKILEVKKLKRYLNWDDIPIIITIKEAAVILHCSEITVKRKLESGVLKGYKDVGGWRISKDYFKSIFAA